MHACMTQASTSGTCVHMQALSADNTDAHVLRETHTKNVCVVDPQAIAAPHRCSSILIPVLEQLHRKVGTREKAGRLGDAQQPFTPNSNASHNCMAMVNRLTSTRQ